MKKKYLQELRRIQERIPQELIAQLIRHEQIAPDLVRVLELALEKPDDEVPPEKKQRIRDLLDSGMLNRTMEVIDKSIEEQVSDLMDKMIAEAVKAGRLPKKAPALTHKSAINKGKQYARRNAQRIKDIAAGPATEPDQAVAGTSPDHQ